MSAPDEGPGQIDVLQQSIRSQLISEADYYVNVRQGIMIVTEDKVRLVLGKHFEIRRRAHQWETPFAIAVTLLSVLLTADFKDRGLPGILWQALFMVGASLAAAYAVWFRLHAVKVVGVEQMLEELKKGQLTQGDLIASPRNEGADPGPSAQGPPPEGSA